MAPTLDAVLLEGWAEAAATALERRCAEIDRINVFPVADRDTGTNLLLTMRAAVAAVRGLRPAGAPSPTGPGTVATAEALARGALLHARGNSGVILSQVLRGVAEAVVAAVAAGARCGGAALADGLARAARLAREAVSHPRDGTVLTVLAAAATAARDTAVGQDTAGPGAGGPDAGARDRLDEVAVAAAGAAAVSLRATTGQLPELALAGVVDAGGLGLSVVLDALAALLAGGTVARATLDRGVPEPGRAEPGRAEPGRAEPGRASRAASTGSPRRTGTSPGRRRRSPLPDPSPRPCSRPRMRPPPAPSLPASR